MFTKVGIVKVTQEAVNDLSHYLQFTRTGATMKRITHGIPEEYAAAFKNKDKTQLVELVLESLKTLDKQGADFAIIPTHKVFEPSVHKRIIEEAPMRSIHMMDSTAEDCFSRNFRSVCFLGPSQEIDLYESPLRNKEISIVRPCKEDQDFLEIVCEAAEASGGVTKNSQENVREIFSKLKKDNPFDALVITHSKLKWSLPWTFTKVCSINPLYSQAIGADEHVKKQLSIMQEFGF